MGRRICAYSNHKNLIKIMDLLQPHFSAITGFIQQARYTALQKVNTDLIQLYWQIGQYISERTSLANQKVSPLVRVLPQDVTDVFKDT